MTVRELKELLSRIENDSLPVILFIKEDDRDEVYHSAELETVTELEDCITHQMEVWLEGFKENV